MAPEVDLIMTSRPDVKGRALTRFSRSKLSSPRSTADVIISKIVSRRRLMGEPG